MNGKFASLIVIASIFATGFVGYLANADVETDERQVYDYSANLVPSVKSSDVKQYTQYNPAENVTGWQTSDSGGTLSNASIPTTSVVSPYVISARTVDYETEWIDKADSVYYTKTTSEVILPNATGWNQGEVEVYTVQLDGEFEEIAYLIFAYDPTASNPVSVYLINREVDGTDIINDLDEIIEDYVISYAHYQGGFTVSKTYDGTNTHSTFVLSTRITDVLGNEILSSTASRPVSVARMSDLESEYETSHTFKTSDVIDLTDYKVYSVPNEDDIGWDLRYVKSSTTRVSMDYRWGASNATLIHDTTTNQPWGLYYNKDTNGWYPATKNDGGLWYQASNTMYSSNKIAIVADTASKTPITQLNWESAVVIPATYADATRMTSIGTLDTETFGATAYWANNNSNGAITFLAKLNDATGNLTITTRDSNGGVNGSWLAKTRADGGLTTPTGYVLITLDNINDRYVYTPVTGIEYGDYIENGVTVQYANPQTYQVGGYTQNLATFYSPTDTDMMRLELAYANTVGEAYVVNTVIQLDPEGRLWSDPALYLGAYFPQAFEADQTPRVWFNAFVALGDYVRINGIEFEVEEGKITVNDKEVELKGMAVDWEKDNSNVVHVYIAPNGKYESRIDLGAVSDVAVSVRLQVGGVETDVQTTEGYVISMRGVWYFEVGLYDGSTEEYQKLDLNLVKGWGLSLTGASLLFCGCIIFFTAVGVYYFKESESQPDFTDWLIIVIVIALTIVIAGLIG